MVFAKRTVQHALDLGSRGLFASRNTPIENGQVACVRGRLEKQFSDAARDVLEHDIDFGELGADYLSNGDENLRKQDWVKSLYLSPPY